MNRPGLSQQSSKRSLNGVNHSKVKHQTSMKLTHTGKDTISDNKSVRSNSSYQRRRTEQDPRDVEDGRRSSNSARNQRNPLESPSPRKITGRGKSPDTHQGHSRNLQMATQIATQFHATEKKTSLLTGGQHSMLDREILQQQADAPIDAG